MKRVEYKKISIKNFLSIGRVPVCVEFRKGIHIITGVNKDKTDRKNGVGKSTIADAFYFAHFGDTIRKIKKELIVNDVTNQTAEVILDVDVLDKGTHDCYRIVRTLKPSKLTLYRNSVDITLDSISNTTAHICDILSLSESVMSNCVVMTLNDTTPFMAKGKPEKRGFIEGVFDLDMFGRMSTLMKRDFSETKKLTEVKRAQVYEIEKSINTLKDQYQKLIVLRSERVQHYEKRKADNLLERAKLLEEISRYTVEPATIHDANIQKLRQAITTILEKIRTFRDDRLKSEMHAENTAQKLEDISKARADGICYECKQVIPRDHLCDDVDKYRIEQQRHMDIVEKSSALIVEWSTKNQKISSKLDSLIQSRHDNIKTIEEQKTRTKRVEMINSWVCELDRDIESAKSSTDSFTDTIKIEVDRFDSENLILAELQEKFKILESTKFILGDEGVKTHIIKKLISMLNSKLTDYIRKLDGNCICRFNEYFEEEIINNKNKVRSYFNFSGAEKKAVDLACLFSFSDIKRMQGGVSYNVSIYDELFDTSLDETGVGHVIDILNDRVEANDECVLIISHRKEAIKAVTGDIIYLEKRNDITVRVDYDDTLS